jgi:outer membrane protein OmpA-like peptidoglycan-associated protein
MRLLFINLLLVISASLLLNPSFSQVKPYYIGAGYNISYAPLRSVNKFIDLYDSTKVKVGGYEIDEEMKHLKVLTGLNIAAGLKVGEAILDISWTRRQKDVFATYQVPDYTERHIKYKTGTVSLGLYAPVASSHNLKVYGGFSLEFIKGKLLTYNLRISPNREWKELNSFGNFGIAPTLQFLYRPVKYVPVDLGVRVYYQANIARNDMSGLETEMYNHWQDDIKKLRATGGNLGIMFQALINIPSVKDRPRREKHIDEPLPQQPLMVTLSGKVTDKTSGTPVDAVIHFTNPAGKTIDVLAKGGNYSTRLNNNETYKVKVESFGYQDLLTDVSISEPVSEYATRDFTIAMLEEGQAMVLNNIYFKVASAELLQESVPELEKIEAFMKNNPTIAVEIAGHTSSEGNDDYNLKLSQDRANAIKSWLTGKGISEKRIKTVGYGKNKPVADNSTEDGRKLNRRVEFRIIKNN